MKVLYKSGPMESLRKWLYKPRRDDRSLLAQFFYADDALNMVAAELDSFDGRKDPERCSTLVNQLRHAQDRVLNITSQIMDQMLGDERVARGFRVKFPEDVLQDNLAGQLWFGAECLAAGSSIMNREEESSAMRPLAKALTRSLETVRSLLREQCLRQRTLHKSQIDDEILHESLKIFDTLFAQFELRYVSAMVNVKTPHEFEAQQLICVLFSESLRRALTQGLLNQEQVDSYDPALMFAVPRLAIVSGLLIYSNGPLSIDKPSAEMSDMFRPFRTLLHKIRSLLWTLSRRELRALERLLCASDGGGLEGVGLADLDEAPDDAYPDLLGDFMAKYYAGNAPARDPVSRSSSEQAIADGDYLPDNIEVVTPILDGLRRLTEVSAADEPSAEAPGEGELRSLSASGLGVLDPPAPAQPDDALLSSLSEQVADIAERLSEAEAPPPPLPSTSHGYLIPNVSSLSHNGSAVFDPEDEGAALGGELPLIVLDGGGIDAEIVSTNVAITNANLSSILLTREESRDDSGDDGTAAGDGREGRARFELGSDSERDSARDSGVSTENASPERSPDAEGPQAAEEPPPEGSGEAASAARSEAGGPSLAPRRPSLSEESRQVLQDWGIRATDEDCDNIERVLQELKSRKVPIRKDIADEREPFDFASCSGLRRRARRSSSRGRRRKGKAWSPVMVILEIAGEPSPLRLDLSRLLDENGCGAEVGCAADEQIALALQAQELAARQQARGKFKSSEDLIHRLYVCIAGVADQLQTNFAADLRNILKAVFLMNQTEDEPEPPPPLEPKALEGPTIEFEPSHDQVIQNGGSFDSVYSAEEAYADSNSDSAQSAQSAHSEPPARLLRRNTMNSAQAPAHPGDGRRKSADSLQASASAGDLTLSLSATSESAHCVARREPRGAVERAPDWVPDVAAPACMRCAAHFSAFRRRHHCRNCGRVFCAACSSTSVPLPRFGQPKPVRVCDECVPQLSRSRS